MNQSTRNNMLSDDGAIPAWIVTIQCILFATLWSVTMLPHTLMLRNTCLILGAAIGLYIVVSAPHRLVTIRAIPLILIAALFFWVTFHLLWIGQNQALQWDEYQSIWKRALLGSIFALGLGISLTTTKRNYFGLIFAGLCGPILIYWFKFFAMLLAAYFEFNLPEALTLFSHGVSSFYIPKISYVFFCLPAYAVTLGCVSQLLKANNFRLKYIFFYMVIIISVLSIFHFENIKNGFAYAFVLAMIFLISLFGSATKAITWKSYALPAIFFGILLGFLLANYVRNDSWHSLAADFRVTINVHPNQVWNNPNFVYPANENGQSVSATNFDRIFYFKTAVDFTKQYPMGYGLVQSSFGHIARQAFPGAPLLQSHSGWMDLILGIGIPGAALLLMASIWAIAQVSNITSPWRALGLWALLSILLLSITTEVAQKNFIDTFVWLIVFVASMSLQKPVIHLNSSSI